MDQILNVADRTGTSRRTTSISGHCRVSSCGCVLVAGPQPSFEPMWIAGKLLRDAGRKGKEWLEVQRVHDDQKRNAAFKHIRDEGAKTTTLGLVFPKFVDQDQIDRIIQPRRHLGYGLFQRRRVQPASHCAYAQRLADTYDRAATEHANIHVASTAVCGVCVHLDCTGKPQSSHFQALCERRQGNVSCAPHVCDDVSEFHGFALSVFRGPPPLFRRAEGRGDQAIGRGFSDISRKFFL